MANRKKSSRRTKGGPYLSAALFCDQILEDRDGTLSAIRIIDTVTLKIAASTPPNQAIPLSVAMLLTFKSGDSPGKHEIRVDMRSPAGKLKRGGPQTHELSEQPYGGVNLKMITTIMVKKGGVFWIEINLDGRRISRTPLNVIVERVQDDSGKPTASADGETGNRKQSRRRPRQ